MSIFIKFLTIGGTIDKIYFDDASRFEIGDSPLKEILSEGLVAFDYEIVPLFRKDSLDMSDDDRRKIREYVQDDGGEFYVITHGTDTLTQTAEALVGVEGKTIVMTGALSPARFRATDATLNVGLAIGAVQSLPPGVYIAMNGQIFPAGSVRKNRQANRFERLPAEGDTE